MYTAPALLRPAPVVETLDPGPRAVLTVADLPVRALHLAYARCGRTVAGHSGHAPDCEEFVRPGLPSGYAYVDELRAGDHFRFLSRGSDAVVRRAGHRPIDLGPDVALLQVASSAPSADDVVHLVQTNTIVRRERSGS